MHKIQRIFFYAISILFLSCSSLKVDSALTENAQKSRFDGAKSVEAILQKMTLEEKIAQLFVIAPEQFDQKKFATPITKMDETLSAFIEKYPVGGFILFAPNIKTPQQTRELTTALKEKCAISPIIAIDEEGGRVARLARNENFFLPKFQSMNAVGSTKDEQNARGAGQIIGGYLAAFGFTLNFAPIADVNTNPENIVIGDRAFDSDEKIVSKMAGAFLSGLHSTGVKGCLKHFPGHGDTKGDTHSDYVAVQKTWDELKKCELVPFIENLKNADCVMVAHVSTPNATIDGLPSSLSKEMIFDRLRTELAFDGVILTDSLGMGAIKKNYTDEEVALLAFEAGNDILLMPNNFEKSYNALLSAVKSGRISETRINESVRRILALKF